MKYLRIIRNNIKDSLKSVFRNFSLSIASISCITITLILVAVAVLLSENVSKFTSDIEKDVTIVVYINKDATDTDIEALKTKIELLSNIDSITYEVHKEGCYRMPELQNRLYLGYFSNANDAVIEARKYFREVDGCYYCSNEAHRR